MLDISYTFIKHSVSEEGNKEMKQKDGKRQFHLVRRSISCWKDTIIESNES